MIEEYSLHSNVESSEKLNKKADRQHEAILPDLQIDEYDYRKKLIVIKTNSWMVERKKHSSRSVQA